VLSSELKEKYPEIRWKGIVGMRNILVHGYDGIDTETLWDVITEDVPKLKAACEKVLMEQDFNDILPTSDQDIDHA
jgi:uncharacterized protein with HEPN domain